MFALQAHSDYITHIKPLSNNQNFTNMYVATSSHDFKVKIWQPSLSTWLLVQTYSGHGSNVYGLEFINEATIASSGVYDLAIKHGQ